MRQTSTAASSPMAGVSPSIRDMRSKGVAVCALKKTVQGPIGLQSVQSQSSRHF
jgi:hypothetical protein